MNGGNFPGAQSPGGNKSSSLLARLNKFRNLRSDRPTKRAEVSLNAFAFLFSEMVKYAHHNRNAADAEAILFDMGSPIGHRLVEYVHYRGNGGGVPARESEQVNVLFFVKSALWRFLFDREASLEKSKDNIEYMICEEDTLINKYIHLRKNQANPNAFIAGIVQGFLDASHLNAVVTAPADSTIRSKAGTKRVAVHVRFSADGRQWE